MPPNDASSDSPDLFGLKLAKVLVWLVYAYFAFATAVLAVAFFLLLFGADPSADFAEWIYRSANRVMDPFRGIFPQHFTEEGSVIDFSIFFAVIMYGLGALLVHGAVEWIDRKIRLGRLSEAPG